MGSEEKKKEKKKKKIFGSKVAGLSHGLIILN